MLEFISTCQNILVVAMTVLGGLFLEVVLGHVVEHYFKKELKK